MGTCWQNFSGTGLKGAEKFGIADSTCSSINEMYPVPHKAAWGSDFFWPVLIAMKQRNALSTRTFPE